MPLPSLEFLFEASRSALQDLLLTCQNRSRNFEKTIGVELQAWIEEEATALLVRWRLDNFEAFAATPTVAPKKVGLLKRGETEKTA